MLKVDKKYYDLIKASPAFAYIKNDEDLGWLLNCIDGDLVPAENVAKPENKEFWEADGFLYLNLGESGRVLRVSAMRAGKLCSFQCKFHRDLIDYITEYETREKFL